MPIYATKEAGSFWGKLAVSKRSRSLATSHFAFIGENRDDKEWRTKACNQIANASSISAKADSHRSFIEQLLNQGGTRIFAKLEASLILNAGDGVIENGGICLDRNSGIPYVPGSAIKAAARRWAIQLLGETKTDDEAAELLAEIAIIFGYGDTEWKSGRDAKHGHSHSDFWLAMVPLSKPGTEHDDQRDQKWLSVSKKAPKIIFETLNITPIYSPEEKPLTTQLPSLAGCIHFLPAFPSNEAKIETDVLTSHHPKYYDGTQSTATDDENPIPIFFPVVAKGTSYQFALLQSQLARPESYLDLAKSWLENALVELGIGAKTNAGYGWFSIDLHAQNTEEEKQKEKQQALKKEEKLASMTPLQRACEELGELDDQAFAETVKDLENKPAETQEAACTLLLNEKKETWKGWRKSKKWKSRLDGIRDTAKKFNITLP